MRSRSWFRRILAIPVAAAATAGIAAGALFGTCGPFTDVAADSFCPLVLEIFYSGITTGTTASTYDPASNVSRLQMAAFLSRSVDGVLKRGSSRAILGQNSTPANASVLGLTTVGTTPILLQSDGADVWVSNQGGNTVSRVRASDGRLLETWTGAATPYGVLVAMGRVLVAGGSAPGFLYLIDPSQPAGAVTTVASTLGELPAGIGFDGARVWTANVASVSIVTPSAAPPWTVTTVTNGFGPQVNGVVYDGANIWVTSISPGRLFRLDAAGAIVQSVAVGATPGFPVFDGTNVWVPNIGSNSITVVRASSGAVLQTLTGNGLSTPSVAAFDGERVLVTNNIAGSVSLWKAADLTALATVPTGTGVFGACSDGRNFWITLFASGQLAKF